MDSTARQQLFRDAVLLAPLTKGGNLPFRRLCVELGAKVTVSEMAVARDVVRGRRGEMALLRRAPEEACFGVQLADRHPEQLAAATRIALEHGADFVDLNLGCPIDLFCRRGLGAALMRKPGKVGTLVAAMREAVDVPVTMQGESLVPFLRGDSPKVWRDAVYYHYQQRDEGRTSHTVAPHYGLRTARHKLMYLYDTDDWEMYELVDDPHEMNNLAHDPEHAALRARLTTQLKALRASYGDTTGKGL